MKQPVIKSFGSINRLYRRGVNICKGCEREYAGCCLKEHFSICTRQAQQHTTRIINK